MTQDDSCPRCALCAFFVNGTMGTRSDLEDPPECTEPEIGGMMTKHRGFPLIWGCKRFKDKKPGSEA